MAIRIPQVKETALPSTTGVRTPGAAAFGAGVTQALGRAGDELLQQQLEEQNRINETKAREAENMMIQKLSDLETAYKQQDPETVFNTQQHYTKAVDSIRNEALDGLENDAQRRMLAPVAERRAITHIQSGKQYAAVAFQKYETDQLTSQAQLNGTDAANHWGTDRGNTSLRAMLENIQDAGERAGLPPEQIALNTDKAVSGATKQAIQLRLENDPLGAKAIFDDAKDNLLPGDRALMEKAVQAYVDKKVAFDVADQLIAKNGGDPQAAWQAAKAIDDPERRKAVQANLAGEIRMQKFIEEDTKRKLGEAAWNKVLTNPTRQNLPPVGVVDPAVYTSMETYITKKQQGEDIKDNDVLVNDLILMPDSEFKKVDLSAHVHELSPTTLAVMKKRQQGDPKEMRVQSNIAELRKRGLAFLGLDTKDSPKAAAQFGADLDIALQKATEAKGGKLSAEEQDKVLQREVYGHKTKIPQSGTSVFGTGWFADKKTLSEFKKELGPIVGSDGSQIPDDVLATVLKNLNANNVPQTKVNILKVLDAYFQKSQKE